MKSDSSSDRRNPRVLNDEDVRAALSPRMAVDAARQALVDAYRGTLAAPPRLHASIGDLTLAFTAGGYPDGRVGFRAYGTWPEDSDQAVLIWDRSGRLEGVVVGWELGARRTGALGAAAATVLARPNTAAVAVVGSGRQAWAQLWALTAVLTPREVRIYSPTAAHRTAFAQRSCRELNLESRAVPSAKDAAVDADLVILATNSRSPVVDADWIKDGAHVTTVGPKTTSAHETPSALAERAALITSDSPEQASAYGAAFFTPRPLLHLGAILSGDHPARAGNDEITLHCSTGLAGSEIVLAATLLGLSQD